MSEHRNALRSTSVVSFPYIALVSLSGIAMAVLNGYNRFAASALAPVLLNLALCRREDGAPCGGAPLCLPERLNGVP